MDSALQPEGLEIARRLQEQVSAYRVYGVLKAAIELGVFAAVEGGSHSAAQIAAACRAKPEMMEKLLTACAALGWLVKHGDRYDNTLTARLCLVPGGGLYQGDWIQHSANVAEYFLRLADDIRLDDVPKPDSHWHHSFIWAMHAIAVAGPARAVATSVDFSGCRTLLDVGGGPGTYSIAICQAWPLIHATLFDLPATCVFARQNTERYGMTERITVREGDWDEDEFGEGFDAVLLSNVLHGPDSGAEAKLAKAFRALAPGGLLVLHDFFLNQTRDGPQSAALFNIWIGAYDGQQIRQIVREAGFEPDGFVLSSDPDHAIFVARRPG